MRTIGPTIVRVSFAQLYICHELPTLQVAQVSLPRLLTQKGVLSVIRPRARNGANRGSVMPPGMSI